MCAILTTQPVWLRYVPAGPVTQEGLTTKETVTEG